MRRLCEVPLSVMALVFCAMLGCEETHKELPSNETLPREPSWFDQVRAVQSGRTDEIHLEHAVVTDEELAHVSGLTRLRMLSIAQAQVTDAGLSHLEGLTSLEKLQLWHTAVTLEGAGALKKVLPKCKIYH